MDIRDEKPSKNFENRVPPPQDPDLADTVRRFLEEKVFGRMHMAPGELSARVKELRRKKEIIEGPGSNYGDPVEVGGMWGNKPTVINPREVFEAQYPRWENRTPYSAESVAQSMDRYLNPDNPSPVRDDQTWRRKWENPRW